MSLFGQTWFSRAYKTAILLFLIGLNPIFSLATNSIVVTGPGCTDPVACNYDALAEISQNDLCEYEAVLNMNVDNIINQTSSPVQVRFSYLQNGGFIDEVFMSTDANGSYPVCVLNGCYRFKIVSNGANSGFEATITINGETLPVSYNDQYISFGEGNCITGCPIPDACNYNPDANIFDFNACVFVTPGYDCDGNCVSDQVDIATLASLSPFQMSDAECGTFAQGTLQGIVDFDPVASTYEFVQDMGNGEYLPIDGPVSYTIDNACLVQFGGGLTFGLNTSNSTLESLEPDPFEVYYYGAICALGTSLAPSLEGCTNETACNYDAAVTTDDGSCTYPEAGQDCDGNVILADAYLYIDLFDCSSLSPFEVTEANSPGQILSGQFILDGQGGVILEEFIGGTGYIQQSRTYTFENGVLTIEGFAPSVLQADGSFVYNIPDSELCRAFIPGSLGCINEAACNYDPNAYSAAGYFMDGGLCEFPAPGYDCDGVCQVDLDPVGTWDQYAITSLNGGAEPNSVVVGMGDLMASSVLTLNSNGLLSSSIFGTATSWTQDCGLITLDSFTDGQFLFVVNDDMGLLFQGLNEEDEFVEFLLMPGENVITGCTDDTACNFEANATESDNTLCTYPEQGFDCDGNLSVVLGCTYENADNYNAEANDDDGSCVFSPVIIFGCTDSSAVNYHPAANQDNGTCLYGNILSCPGDFNDDGAINAGDLLLFLGFFGSSCN